MAKSADGTEVAVQATPESLDKNVLDADPVKVGQFVARSQGQTQLHAVYRGKEVFAKVSVSGKRFENVNPALNELSNDQFDVTIEVLAAAAEGELEYRVYSAEDASPKENWVPNQADGDNRKVTLRSDALNYGPRGQIYHLVLEARDKTTKRTEKYPLSLQLGVTLKKVENSQVPVKDSNPGKDTK